MSWIHAAMWMNLKIGILNEKSELQKTLKNDKWNILPLMQINTHPAILHIIVDSYVYTKVKELD